MPVAARQPVPAAATMRRMPDLDMPPDRPHPDEAMAKVREYGLAFLAARDRYRTARRQFVVWAAAARDMGVIPTRIADELDIDVGSARALIRAGQEIRAEHDEGQPDG